MNQQMKNFYDQVGLDFENFQRVTVTKGDMEKFAELIVAECATLIPAEQSHAPNGQPILKIFQEHFGVEE